MCMCIQTCIYITLRVKNMEYIEGRYMCPCATID